MKSHAAIDKVTLHNIEMEEALITSLLKWPEHFYSISNVIKSADFFSEVCKSAFEVMPKVLERGSVDIVTMADAMKGKTLPSGHSTWLMWFVGLEQNYGTAYDTENYAKAVAEMATRRRVAKQAQDMIKSAFDLEKDVEEILSESESGIFSFRSSKSTSISRPNDYIDSYLVMQEKLRADGKIDGVSTGFKDVDRLLNGFQSPQLYVWAGRPGMGKSALAIRHAEAVAQAGGRVLFFSLEMSEKQIMDRRVSAHSHIPINKIQRPFDLTSEEFEIVKSWAGHLKQYDFMIDTTPALTPSAIRAKAMRAYNEGGLDLIVIDHLILMRPDRDMRRSDLEYGEMTQTIFETSKLIGCPTLLLTQLNRGVEARQNKRPMLSDLRESGRIEENAYCVSFVYRPVYYDEMTDQPNKAELIIAKNREGATGTVDLYCDLSIASFGDYEPKVVNL